MKYEKSELAASQFTCYALQQRFSYRKIIRRTIQEMGRLLAGNIHRCENNTYLLPFKVTNNS